jgi:hypothetical protein
METIATDFLWGSLQILIALHMATFINYYWLSGVGECGWPNGVDDEPKLKGPGNVTGCGILLNPEDKLFIFFTFNGILLGNPRRMIRPNHFNTILNAVLGWATIEKWREHLLNCYFSPDY